MQKRIDIGIRCWYRVLVSGVNALHTDVPKYMVSCGFTDVSNAAILLRSNLNKSRV